MIKIKALKDRKIQDIRIVSCEWREESPARHDELMSIKNQVDELKFEDLKSWKTFIEERIKTVDGAFLE